MKVKIRLDTYTDAVRFSGIATALAENVYLTDGAEMRVSAKSLMGTLYATFDFREIWLETEKEHYFSFKDFIVEE